MFLTYSHPIWNDADGLQCRIARAEYARECQRQYLADPTLWKEHNVYRARIERLDDEIEQLTDKLESLL